KWREDFGEFADPRAVETRELREQLSERDAADQAAADAKGAEQRAVIGDQFWEVAHSAAKEKLADFPNLDESDIPELMEQFYVGYQAHQDELEDRYLEIAESKGIPADEAIQAAHQDAVRWLNEANMFSFFTRRNDALQAKLARRNGQQPTPTEKPGGTTVIGPNAQDDANAHNSRVDSKLAQTRSLLSGRTSGASIALPPKTADKPLTWDESRKRMHDEFAKIR
ncbi:MAG: hypothetical protein ACREQB_03840, partial [Candidatus Binataceae bacterium]